MKPFIQFEDKNWKTYFMCAEDMKYILSASLNDFVNQKTFNFFY